MADARPPHRFSSRAWPARLAAGVAVAALLVTGCASIPTTGAPQSTPTPPPAGVGGSGCCLISVPGPQPGWSAQTVVAGFLYASADAAHDYASARRYLTPAASRSWHPGSRVVILADKPLFVTSRLIGPGATTTVRLFGPEVGTLNGGQYTRSASGGQTAQLFTLQHASDGRLLISGLPSTRSGTYDELLLTDNLFHLVYTPYDVYYYGLRNDSLVPVPVYVQRTNPNLVQTLIGHLRHDPGGLLAGAAVTSFPPRMPPVRSVQALPGVTGGKTAIVAISLPRGTSPNGVPHIAAQLVCTLTSSAYGYPSLFQAVKIEINGRVWSPRGGGPVQLGSSCPQSASPRLAHDAALYYVGAKGGIQQLRPLATRGTPVPGPAGTGTPPLHEIAVSPDGKYLAGIAGGVVYVSNLAAAREGALEADGLQSRLSGSQFAPPSWDSSDDLWVAGRYHGREGVWVIRAGGGTPARVTLPPGLGPVTGLRVAPGGVRVALVVGRGSHSQLMLGAIQPDGANFSIAHTAPLGPGVSGITSLTWYDQDHLLVIAHSQGAAQLQEVPVDGQQATPRPGLRGMVSVTAAGPHQPLYLGLTSRRLEKSVGLSGQWTDFAVGAGPVYPG